VKTKSVAVTGVCVGAADERRCARRQFERTEKSGATESARASMVLLTEVSPTWNHREM
jgi:hypothetical protein